MKKRIRKKTKEGKLKEEIKDLGFRIESWKRYDREITYTLKELPDFLWGYWENSEKPYFGTFRWFYDKFRPSQVDYSFKTIGEFLKFLGGFRGDYKGRILELIRQGNIDYNYHREKPYRETDEEIWAEFMALTDLQKFRRSHFGLTPEEWEEALEEKKNAIEDLKEFPGIQEIRWKDQNNSGGGFYIGSRIGSFTVSIRSEEDREDIYYYLFSLRYCQIFRPKIIVGKRLRDCDGEIVLYRI